MIRKKKIYSLIGGVFVGLILLTACSKEKRTVDPLLLDWEKSVNLGKWEIPTDLDTTKYNAYEKMLYTYLYAKCDFYVGKTIRNASVLEPSIAYFEKIEDYTHLAQLYYLQGKIYKREHYIIRASESFRQAENLAGENDALKITVNLDMAEIYRIRESFHEEDSCLEKAEKMAIQLVDTALLAKVWHQHALSCVIRKNYDSAYIYMRKALQNMELTKKGIDVPIYYKDMSMICQAVGKFDSALCYVNKSICSDKNAKRLFYYKTLKGAIFLDLNCIDSASYYLERYKDRLPLKKRVFAYRDLYKLKKCVASKEEQLKILENYIALRDSLDSDRKDDLSEKIHAMQTYKQEFERANHAELKLSKNQLIYYRIIVVIGLIVIILLIIHYRTKQKKRNLQTLLQQEQIRLAEANAKKQEVEMCLLKEQERVQQHEIERLNQNVSYYKRLNAITLPVLMRRKNSQGAMHLTADEWGIIVENTDACFNSFTTRLKEQYPQLSEDEIRFCCLVRMELPLSLLAEIYHIAKGSISRKKMRLKEKMNIMDISFDEFIMNF